MRFLAAILLLCCLIPSRAATGDVLNGAVLDNGWMAVLRIEGGATNGTFDIGFANATNHTFNGSEKFRMAVNSPGFAVDVSTNVWTGTLYGTHRVRFAYPDEDYPRVYIDGSDALIYIALSDYVYSEDTGMTATIGAGLYTSSTATNNAASITLTNWSTQPYTKAVANWTWPGYQQVTSATMRLRAAGFHGSAANGQPLAALSFIVTDESSDSVTSTQTRMQIDRTLPDVKRFGEYVADIDLSTLTHSNLLRCDFVAYPVRGNPSSVLDTRLDTYTMPTPLPAAITNFYYTPSYSAIAVVAVGGSDANGRATNITDYAAVDSSHYFASINGAMAAIKGTNNTLFGHNDCGGAKVYVRTGIVQFSGGTASTSGTPIVWAEVIEYPGDTVVLTGDTGNDDISDRVKLQGIEIAHATTSIPFSGIDALWFDQCVINSSGSGPIQTCKTIYLTHCTVPQYAAGLEPFSAGNMTFSIVRGCDLSGLNSRGAFWTWAGNYGNNVGPNFRLVDWKSPWGAPNPEFLILYNNEFLRVTNLNTSGVLNNVGSANGMAIIQNVFETARVDSSFAVNSSTTVNCTNAIWFNNTLEGPRNQWFYNETGSTGAVKILNFAKNSIHVTVGEATDTAGLNAGLTNDWSMRYRVGASGNIYQQLVGAPVHGDLEFSGLNTFRSEDTPTSWIKYIDGDGAYRGGAGDGGGNYRLRSDSPLFSDQWRLEWVLPFDLDGLHRGRIDPAGAYASGNARKGAFF